MKLPDIPRSIIAGGDFEGETRAQSGLRVWKSLLSALETEELSGKSIFDIGCGDRLTHAIVELSLPVTSYFGIDPRKPLILWMLENVKDQRCDYAQFNVFHQLYWRSGDPLTKRLNLPGKESDIIFAQSVFSHLYPHDTDVMLALARRKIRSDGHLVFTCFLSEEVVLFEDKNGAKPTQRVFYNPAFLNTLLRKNGWDITRILPPGEPGFGQGEQDSIVCRPIEPLPLPEGFG